MREVEVQNIETTTPFGEFLERRGLSLGWAVGGRLHRFAD